MGNRIALALLVLGLGTLHGCCFGGTHRSIDLPVVPPPTPVPTDPSLDALWACHVTSVTGHHCPAPEVYLPASELEIAITYRTENLARFRMPGTFIAYVGEVTPVEITRAASGDTAAVAPALPGEVLTWNEQLTLACPDTGWPVGVPVQIELRDSAGARVAATMVTFTGPPVVPPPRRAQHVVNICSDRTVAGLPDHPFCPVTEPTIARGPGRIYVSFTSDNPALWAQGSALVFERRNRRGAWEQEDEVTEPPIVLAAEEMETVRVDYDLSHRDFARGSHWRARFVSAGNTFAEREVDIE